jgi:hypothetical protein
MGFGSQLVQRQLTTMLDDEMSPWVRRVACSIDCMFIFLRSACCCAQSWIARDLSRLQQWTPSTLSAACCQL